MANQTETIKITDVVKSEAASHYCREVFTVKSAEVLSLGEVCYLDATPELVACAAAADEVQLLNIAGTITGGTFKIGITLPQSDINKPGTVIWTDTIAWNATFATVITNINAALDNAFGSGLIVATGTAWTAISLTFSGAGWTEIPIELVDLDCAALTGADVPVVTRTTAGHAAGGDATHVALETVTGDGTLTCLTIARGPCVLDQNRLTVPTGGLANVVAALKALGIVARPEPTEYTEGES